ncbi:hypothetical protein AT245_07610 [Bartonella henselae]|nr:hypothetical protein AT244_00135 [Bartonella henselae]OLL45249.1 hypothetical protein AT245_07610 [Bartonella henselae]
MTAWGQFSQSYFCGEAPIGGRAMKSNAFKMIFLLSQKRTILLESIEKYSSFHIVPLFFNLPFLADHLLAFVIFNLCFASFGRKIFTRSGVPMGYQIWYAKSECYRCA